MSEKLGSVTINYVYGPLYRLKQANYSDGRYFHYTYDAAGNRLSQTVCFGPGCTPVTTTYTYDNANRLATVNGVAQTWDKNGNLTQDNTGATYAYDSANRLKTLTQGTTTSSYVYNGLGDRLQQTVSGVTTTYTLDLTAGLTQVLADGTNTYLYGAGRIAQNSTANGKQYFLGDALGSVRQLVSANGAVTLTRSYEPYGSVLTGSASAGVNTAFGFTGEASDGYLRARYYLYGVGRFITKDPSRTEANLYLYALANPVNRTDPSGLLSNAQIAQSFGYYPTEFSKVVSWFSVNAPNHWALLAALQDANNNDSLGVGVDDAIAYEWVVAVNGGNTYLLDYNYSSTHKNFSLKDFASYIIKTSTHGLPSGNPINDYYDKINMYFVNGTGRGFEKGYKAFNQFHGGWMRTPDVKAFAGLSPIPAANVKIGVGGGYQILIDRYGYIRFTGEFGVGAGVTAGSTIKGWITKNGDSSILNEKDIATAVEGLSLNVSASAAYSRGESGSLSDILTYRIWWEGWSGGVMVTACSVSYTTGSIFYRPDLSWDWVDRARAYTIQDIVR